jgi:hypothetical protein
MRPVYVAGVGALLILAGCSEPNERVMTKLNEGAALAGDLPANPLQWKVITSGTDGQDQTMWTLFGNDVAVQYARTNPGHQYPAGSVLSRVTWTQQEDGRWFGGKIPAQPKSVEFVTVRTAGNGRLSYLYQDYEGSPLKERSTYDGPTPDGRAADMVSQRAAVMP